MLSQSLFEELIRGIEMIFSKYVLSTQRMNYTDVKADQCRDCTRFGDWDSESLPEGCDIGDFEPGELDCPYCRRSHEETWRV
jgi:hypothetical protein